jgi:hypothetical protein
VARPANRPKGDDMTLHAIVETIGGQGEKHPGMQMISLGPVPFRAAGHN